MKIYTYTILHSTTPAFADRLPYVCSILEAPDGTRSAAMLEGYAEGVEVKVGQSVRALGPDTGGKVRYTLA